MAQDSRHWPRLRGVEVDPSLLSTSGAPLADVVRAVADPAVADEPPHTSPPSGWRVIARPSGTYTLLAAPAEPTADGLSGWWVGQLHHADGQAQLQFLRAPVPLTRSRAEAARDLSVRWPRALGDSPPLDHVVVDIVNTGSTIRVPGEDGFRAVGRVVPAGARPRDDAYSFGYISGGDREVVLGPGDYARVPVHVVSWEGLTPGPHDLHVVVLDNAPPEPLRVEVTSNDLSRHARRPRTARR